ncbi:MAG: PAS domain S-box protein, partial [Pirellulaceae bacterium]
MSDVLPSSPDSAVHRRETERLQRLLLRAERLALLGSWELDLETGTVRASPGLQELFQRPLGESGQTTFVEALGMIHEDDRARVAAAYAQVLEVGTPAPIDFRLRLSDGSCRHVHCDSEVVEYDGQTPKVVAGFVLDTTRQVAAEAALRESERRLRQVLDGMMIHAGLISLDGVLLDVNRVPLEFAGLQREAVIGRHLWETSWFDGLPHQQLKVRDALHRVRNGESVRCDLQCRLDDEHLRTVDASFCPLRDEAGVITQIIGSAVDITDRLRDQDELHNHQDELTHVLRVVTMGELAAGIVHELNQPLMAITNYAERLKLYAGSLTAGEAASIVKTADKIADQSVRAGDIIRRLRDL